MPLPRRALVAITGASATLYQGKQKTGMFISEAMHPFKVLTAAGFEVDLALESGTYALDDLSLSADFLSGDDRADWDNESSPFRVALANLAKASDLKPEVYGLFFASAGYAALIDYPKATALQHIAENIWARGGVVSAVCHGPSILANIHDPATGKLLIQGKTIAGYTTQAEEELGVMPDIRSWHADLVEEIAAKSGAKYVRGPGIWDDFHTVNGRLVTGQNPQSARSTAAAAVEVFDKL